MNYKTIFLTLSLAILIFGCSDQTKSGQANQNNQVDNNNLENHISVTELPTEEISPDELDALIATLNDEFKAEAIYQKVVDKFGEVRPFINIIRAEQKHSDALILLFNKYNIELPTNDWSQKVPEFNSVQEACQAGVQAEIDNAALYDNLFSKVDNQDIIQVFTSLRDASLNNHLPAFQRCAGTQI